MIEDKNIFGVEFTKNGFTVKFRICDPISLDQHRNFPTNKLQVVHSATLICENKMYLMCSLCICNNGTIIYKYNINREVGTPTELDLYIGKLGELISRICDVKLQTKVVTIDNINQLVANYGFDFTMIMN